MEFREVAVERHASAANEQDALRDGRGYFLAGDLLSSVYRAAHSVRRQLVIQAGLRRRAASRGTIFTSFR